MSSQELSFQSFGSSAFLKKKKKKKNIIQRVQVLELY